jgi:deaminated glutathione amidase
MNPGLTPTLRIAALQMVSAPEVATNLATADGLVAAAAEAGAQVVVLPEYFCLMGRRDDDKLVHAEAPTAVGDRPGDGQPIQHRLSQAAARHGVWVIGGTLPIQAGRGTESEATGQAVKRVYNSCTVWSPDGRLASRYDKVHLFRFDNGRESYDEARVLMAGSGFVAVDIDGWRVGLSICYDLRFPELYRSLMHPPCDLLVVPAAFTHTTGQAHWELLLRARAVENQCYVLAAAQGGQHPNGRRTFGHSLAVDPWGSVLACQAEGAGVVMATMERTRLAQVRQQLPALDHRRGPGG